MITAWLAGTKRWKRVCCWADTDTGRSGIARHDSCVTIRLHGCVCHQRPGEPAHLPGQWSFDRIQQAVAARAGWRRQRSGPEGGRHRIRWPTGVYRRGTRPVGLPTSRRRTATRSARHSGRPAVAGAGCPGRRQPGSAAQVGSTSATGARAGPACNPRSSCQPGHRPSPHRPRAYPAHADRTGTVRLFGGAGRPARRPRCLGAGPTRLGFLS